MRILTLSIAILVLGAGFGLVEWRWPSIRGQRRLRAGVFTDLTYFFYTSLLGKLLTGIFVGVAIILITRLIARPLTAQDLRGLAGRDTAVSHQPVLLQLVEFLLVADFVGYWSHRAFHSVGRLWRIHAVHHSSTELDWLSSVRVHPLNDAISSFLVATPLLLLGFSRLTVGAYLPFLTLYAIGLHANVSWGFGPVGAVLASPRFHRWHHSAEPAAVNKNFAGLFVFWDRLFGTYYMPKGVQPHRFGVSDQRVPAGFFSQLVYPFRKPVPAVVEEAVAA